MIILALIVYVGESITYYITVSYQNLCWNIITYTRLFWIKFIYFIFNVIWCYILKFKFVLYFYILLYF